MTINNQRKYVYLSLYSIGFSKVSVGVILERTLGSHPTSCVRKDGFSSENETFVHRLPDKILPKLLETDGINGWFYLTHLGLHHLPEGVIDSSF